MNLDMLQVLAEKNHIDVVPYEMSGNLQALYVDGYVFLNTRLNEKEKACVLAEEIGHYFTADRNCLDQNQSENLFCELKGRIWSYEVMLPVSQLNVAMYAGITTVNQIAEFFQLTEDFVKEALCYYFYSGQINEKVPCEAATSTKAHSKLLK